MVEQKQADTRERILDAAETLFMAHGYEGTSMRQITSTAQVNLAAVNYHFGSKEELIKEVFRRRLDSLNEARLRALDDMEREAAGQPLQPEQIIDGFFGTLLRQAVDEERGGVVFLRLLGRMINDPSEFIRSFFASEYAEVVARYKAALFKALPDVPREELQWRFQFMLGATSYSIAGTDALHLVADLPSGESEEEVLDRLQSRLMSFLLGGLRAPVA